MVNHITVKDGLESNNIRCLTSDAYGRIWIGYHEGAIGGTNISTTSTQVIPPVGTYLGSNMGSRISKIDWDGVRTTVADNLPSTITQPVAGSEISGVTDIAFIGNTLYGILAGAGCSHGVPDIPNGVFKVNSDKTWTIVANSSAFLMNNPVAHSDPDDFEPDGTAYSMVNVVGNPPFSHEMNSEANVLALFKFQSSYYCKALLQGRFKTVA